MYKFNDFKTLNKIGTGTCQDLTLEIHNYQKYIDISSECLEFLTQITYSDKGR
jgi:hypothetical protein